MRTFFVEKERNPKADQVYTIHIREYLDWRRTTDQDGTARREVLSNRTLELERAILNMIFKALQAEGVTDRNPVNAVPAPKVDPRDPVILSDVELERLLANCEHNDFLHLFVLTMAETGARSESEVLWIQFGDVDFEGRFLWIDSSRNGHRTKSGRGRLSR